MRIKLMSVNIKPTFPCYIQQSGCQERFVMVRERVLPGHVQLLPGKIVPDFVMDKLGRELIADKAHPDCDGSDIFRLI